MVVRSGWMCIRRLLILLTISAIATAGSAQDAEKHQENQSAWTFE